jgi:hypothetical protein
VLSWRLLSLRYGDKKKEKLIDFVRQQNLEGKSMAKTEKKKVAITRDTADQLKAFSRLNGLKMRLVIDSMVDLILQNDELSKQVAKLTLERGGENEVQT